MWQQQQKSDGEIVFSVRLMFLSVSSFSIVTTLRPQKTLSLLSLYDRQWAKYSMNIKLISVFSTVLYTKLR